MTTSGATTATTTAAATATTTAATSVATSAAETPVASETLNPMQTTINQTIPYQNAFAVYEVKNPTPPPADPRPIRKDVHPPLPIGRVRRVDPLVLRQEWEKRKKTRQNEPDYQENAQSRPPVAEKSLREVINQTNEDLAASGIPLHLVLVENSEGFTLDIYDCSDNTACQLAQEVPLDLNNNLLTILDNLEHEAGIIVNIKT